MLSWNVSWVHKHCLLISCKPNQVGSCCCFFQRVSFVLIPAHFLWKLLRRLIFASVIPKLNVHLAKIMVTSRKWEGWFLQIIPGWLCRAVSAQAEHPVGWNVRTYLHKGFHSGHQTTSSQLQPEIRIITSPQHVCDGHSCWLWVLQGLNIPVPKELLGGMKMMLFSIPVKVGSSSPGLQKGSGTIS